MWSARKHDPEASEEIAQRHGAKPDAGRYHKVLLPKAALAEIQKIVSEARQEHYFMTLPWDDNGYRVLPAAAYMDHTEQMWTPLELFPSSDEEGVRGWCVKNTARGSTTPCPLLTKEGNHQSSSDSLWRRPGYDLAVCSVRRIIRLPKNSVPPVRDRAFGFFDSYAVSAVLLFLEREWKTEERCDRLAGISR
jgi:hypothetical protein